MSEPSGQPTPLTGLEVVERLARAARQMALYGPDHPVTSAAVQHAVSFLGDAASGVAELRAEDESLLWNQELLPSQHSQVAWLRQAMYRRVIGAIVFRPPVSAADLARALEVLAQDPEVVVEAATPDRVLFRAPGGTVELVRVDFLERLRESEIAWLECCESVEPEAAELLGSMVQYCLRATPWHGEMAPTPGQLPVGADVSYGEDRAPREVLAEALARLIQLAGERADFSDEEHCRAWLEGMLRHLRRLDSEWRAELFRSPSGASAGYPDMLTLLAREMSPEECISLVLDYPGAIIRERSSSLGQLLSRIMSDPQRQELIEPRLREAALKAGISPEVYRNVVGVLLLRLQEGLAPELSETSWSDPAAPSEGSDTTDLSDLLASLSPRQVRSSRLQMLLELVELDLAPRARVRVLHLLPEAIRQQASDGEAEAVWDALFTLQQATLVGDQVQREAAAAALAQAGAPAVVQMVAAAAEQAEGEERTQKIEMLALLGDIGLEALAAMVRQGSEQAALEAARALLLHEPPPFSHLQQLLSLAPVETVVRLVRAAATDRGSGSMEALQVLPSHPRVDVRLAAVRELARHPSPGAIELLSKFIWDPDLEVKLAAIRALGEARASSAVASLCAMVRLGAAQGEPVAAREEAIRALGQIASPDAVPTLGLVLSGGGLIERWRGSSLRMAAVRALAQIPGPEAQQLLERYSRDRQRALRDACREALVGRVVAGPSSPSEEREHGL